MGFENEKKTFLAKLDKSKKGSIDTKIIPLLTLFNEHKHYYTTSSCSGRVYLWKGTGKKNETEWINVSHDFITNSFFNIRIEQETGLKTERGTERATVWLRVEPSILHVACRDIPSANMLLEQAQRVYKKSCILSASNKIIVELRGSEFMEMPLYNDGTLLISDIDLLTILVNKKMESIFQSIEKLAAKIKKELN